MQFITVGFPYTAPELIYKLPTIQNGNTHKSFLHTANFYSEIL